MVYVYNHVYRNVTVVGVDDGREARKMALDELQKEIKHKSRKELSKELTLLKKMDCGVFVN